VREVAAGRGEGKVDEDEPTNKRSDAIADGGKEKKVAMERPDDAVLVCQYQ
jgi:hypothetical protein